MNPHHVAHRAGEKLERVILPQGRLFGHRQFFEVVKAPDILGENALLLEYLLVIRHVVIAARHRLLEFFQLEIGELISAHRLEFLLPEHFCTRSLFFNLFS